MRNVSRFSALCLLFVGCMAGPIGDETDVSPEEVEATALDGRLDRLVIGQSVAVNLIPAVSQRCLEPRYGSPAATSLVQQSDCRGTEALSQQWRVTSMGNGLVRISSLGGAPGTTCLDVKDASQADGGAVMLYPCGSQTNQLFTATYVPSAGKYQLKALHSGKCLDVRGASPLAGTFIQQWQCASDPALSPAQQLWELRAPQQTDLVVTPVHSGRCLDVVDVSTANGAAIQQYSCLGSAQTNQVWQLKLDPTYGTYQLVAKHSGKCIATTQVGGQAQDGGAVTQQDCSTNVSPQRWYLTEVTTGNFKLEAQASSGKCLDVAGASEGDGARLQTWSCHGGPNQLFRIQSAAPTKVEPGVCAKIGANRGYQNYIETDGPSGGLTAPDPYLYPGCSPRWSVAVSDFQSDLVHIRATYPGSCQTAYADLEVYKWGQSPNVLAGNPMHISGSNPERYQAVFTDSNGTCILHWSLTGTNAPFLEKGTNYTFAVRTYTKSGAQIADVPFRIWSNISAGITTLAAGAETEPMGVSRWVVWRSYGKRADADPSTLQSDPRMGLEPPSQVVSGEWRFQRGDYARFLLPTTESRRSIVFEGYDQSGYALRPAVTLAMSFGHRVDTGAAVVQLRLGADGVLPGELGNPLFAVFEPKAPDKVEVTIRHENPSAQSVTQQDLDGLSKVLAALGRDARLADVIYSCASDVSDAGFGIATTLGLYVTAVILPVTVPFYGVAVAIYLGAGGVAAFSTGINIRLAQDSCNPDGGANVPEPQPDVRPVPLPPDPTPAFGDPYPPDPGDLPQYTIIGAPNGPCGTFKVQWSGVMVTQLCSPKYSCKALPAGYFMHAPAGTDGVVTTGCFQACTTYKSGKLSCRPL